MRFVVSRPFLTAATTARIAPSGSGGMSRTSAPASKARTAASPLENPLATPPISSASVTIRPWNFNSSRRSPVMMAGERVAGGGGGGQKGGGGRGGQAGGTPGALAARERGGGKITP